MNKSLIHLSLGALQVMRLVATLYLPALAVYPHLYIMVRLHPKLLAAISRTGGPSRPSSILPTCPSARHIGQATLVSGLVGAAPLLPMSPLAAVMEGAPDNDGDLGQAKSALRVLAALGDGIAGVPWLKGAAGLGLEIVDVLEVSRDNKWCS